MTNKSRPIRVDMGKGCSYDTDVLIPMFVTGIIHPIHIHGHHFTVVAPSRPSTVELPGTIQRDVVHVPLDGLARVRFIADNPGKKVFSFEIFSKPTFS